MRYIVAFLSVVWIFLSGCTPADNHHNFPNTAKVNHCENTFVLSGYGESIMLFEHEVNSTQFQLLRWYDDGDDGRDAFYDCQSNQIISFLEGGNNSGITEGIRFFDLKDNHRTIVKTHEGFNGVITRYKRGFIYSTANVKHAKVDTEKYGYIPLENMYCEGGDDKLWYTKHICKNGELWYTYTEDKLFSIDTRKVIDTYPFGMFGYAELVHDDLYVYASDFMKINLKTKKATKLWNEEKKSGWDLSIPKNTVWLPVNGVYNIITASNSWDTDLDPNSLHGKTALKHFKKGALYQIKDQNLSFVTKLPLEDIVYANSLDKKYLYIFTKSRKVMKYDIENNTTVATYTIPVDIDPKYVLGTVGFTKDNFILTFQEPGWARAYVVVANRDFSKISQPYYIEMAGINVTTQQSVQTNHDRVNDIE